MKNDPGKIFSFLRYYILSDSKYRIHSPYVYDFVINVLKSKDLPEKIINIEKTRKKLLKNNNYISYQDYGAGSNKKITNNDRVKISKLTRNSVISKKYALLLYHIVKHYQFKNILELGTSFGIGSMYIASGNENALLTTIEGDPSIYNIAVENIKKASFENIQAIKGAFDKKIEEALNAYNILDMAYIDGNHRYRPTIKYFEKCLKKCGNHSAIILDDIRWSDEMFEAWCEIVKHPEVKVSIDLFRMGIVFFRKESTKQDFIIRF